MTLFVIFVIVIVLVLVLIMCKCCFHIKITLSSQKHVRLHVEVSLRDAEMSLRDELSLRDVGVAQIISSNQNSALLDMRTH